MGVLIKTQEQIHRDIINSLESEGTLTDISPGNAAYVLSQAFSRELASAYRSTDLNTSLSYLSNAQGAILDLWGAVYGITRGVEQVGSSSASSRNVRFYVTSGTLSSKIPSKIIPSGVEITTSSGSPIYKTTTETPFNDVVSEVFVSVASTEVGESQRVGKNQLVSHSLGDPTVKVINSAAIANATGVETDAQFKTRISDALLTGVTANTASLLEAINIVAGVSETTIEPYANGPGTVRFTVIPVANAASTDMLAQTQANVEIVRGAGTLVEIRGPRFVPVEIVVLLTFTNRIPEGDKDPVRRQASQAILSYLNILRLGQPFIVNEMIQRIMDVHEEILDLEIRCFSFRRRPQVVKSFVPDPDEIFIPDPSLEQPIKVL